MTTIYTLTAAPGSIALTGSTASLKNVLQAAPGAFAMSGVQTGLVRRLMSTAGVFHFTGKTASVTYIARNPNIIVANVSDYPYVTPLTEDEAANT